MKLKIAWLYRDLMSTYGDRGNIICLTQRCQIRHIDVEVKNITLETSVKELNKCDVIFMGGAQDRQQKLAGGDFLKNKGPVIKKMVEENIPSLFVCAAYQAVGHYYRPYKGADIPGPGILDLTTKHLGDQAKRLIGDISAEIINIKELNGKTIVGFENHGGRTSLGAKLKPFAKVIKGFGNNGEDGYEGAVYKNAIGSYFHGPILSKNPHLADWLIGCALEIKYQKDVELEPLDDELEWKAHDFMLKRL
ncbi:cobalamin biosynthesis protein CobQ [Candidatus Gottesmanbacteria bacterium]|nr:cobalamin biosynthesis protein CobQ [Candidatus Gottesmanbacteria bacterium]